MSNCARDIAKVKLGLAAEILRSRPAVHVRGIGTSMIPSIWPGDLLVVENCEPSDIRVGDIIRFMQAGRFVIHRVISVANDSGNISWITRGDFVTRDDLPVSERHFLGRVCTIRRHNRCFPPSQHLSRTAYWVGRTLQTLYSLQGLVSRVRHFLRKRSDAGSEWAKAWK
jgi:signal peptidase I